MSEALLALHPGIRLVVGIGASAGGLEPLEHLFEHMLEKSGCAFVVVQHLSPDVPSMLDQLLARRTRLPISMASDGMLLLPDTITLSPASQRIAIHGGRIVLSDRDPTELAPHPIDLFFHSLAKAGPRAVAIVLSGSGSDGARWLCDVHAAGGMVLAQSPESAEFSGMPQSAIATGFVDRIVIPEEIGDVLLERIDAGTDAARSPVVPASEESGFSTIMRLLRDAYGIDFSSYKPSTIFRRTRRRAEMAGMTSLEAFAARLSTDTAELGLLYKDLLIGVTRFFRDSAAFEHLAHDVLPGLIDALGASEELRIWVAGCATGEEAYSIAMLACEAMGAQNRSNPIKIFATDIHPESLRIAGIGIYDASAVVDVPPERLERFFVPREGRFQIKPELRAQVVFAPHNVLKDAPFTHLDLISCRNMLIYFEPFAQRRALVMFHFGLKPRGCLMLGSSETLGELSQEFEVLDHRSKLFRKRRDVRLTADLRFSVPARMQIASGGPLPALTGESRLAGAYDALLEECMPPSFLVDSQRSLAHTFGGASRYLRPHDGRRTNDLADLLEGDVRIAVLGALQRVFNERAPVVYKGMRVELSGEERLVDITARPIRSHRGGEMFALVVLHDGTQQQQQQQQPAEIPLEQASREHVLALENELKRTHANLQSTIEELGTSNEELQASNEELVASNEELQSTNEELHSVNQELHTLTSELQSKISELSELNADMEHLLATTEVHTLFLDKQLGIRKFTPRIAEIFNLVPHDIGRSIEVFTHTLHHPSLVEDIRSVANQGTVVEKHVGDDKGHCFLLRILPYRSGDRHDGAVLTLIDVTGLQRAQTEAERMQLLLSSILQNSPSQIFIKDASLRYLMVDDTFRQLAGRDPVGMTANEVFAPAIATALAAGEDDVVKRGIVMQNEISLPGQQGTRTYLSLKFPMRAPDGSIGIGGINTDVTNLKRAEHDLRQAVRQRDLFLATLSHELRNPLAAVFNAATLLHRQALPDEPRRWVDLVLEGAQYMNRLVDDLLDISRVTQNKMELKRQHFDLRTIVDLALRSVSSAVAEKRIGLEQHITDSPLPVHGDAVRLQQVLSNLLGNAVRYTQEGGRVALTLALEANAALIRVADTGIGIAPYLLERIFEPFVQGYQPGERGRDSGLGIGLSLVRHIVMLHNGTVTAASSGVGRGAEFKVRLPLSEAAADKPQPAPPSASGPPAALRVLLVEDDARARAALEELLRDDGLAVTGVGSGQAALDVLDAASPDVILLDIGMQGMNGYEACRKIRERKGRGALAIIALTGFGQDSDRGQAKEAGFDAHVTKPVDLDTLYRVIASTRAALSKGSSP